MSLRMHAIVVLVRRRTQETVIDPVFYIALTIGLVLAYLLAFGFVRSVDSSGLNFSLNPVYDLIHLSLQGIFGATMVDELFAEGPFIFILYIASLPVQVYLSVRSVFRIGLEKRVGALELLSYGPIDGTSYFLASFVNDLILTGLHILLLLVFLWITAALNNLVLGPTFYFSLVIMFFLYMAIYAFGIFTSTLTDNSASAVALFLGIMLFFLVVLAASFAIISGYVQSLSSVLAWIVKWISPFFYSNLGLQAAEVRRWGLYLLSLLLLTTLSGLILVASHFVLKTRGVRP